MGDDDLTRKDENRSVLQGRERIQRTVEYYDGLVYE